jgi:hypothetical protein
MTCMWAEHGSGRMSSNRRAMWKCLFWIFHKVGFWFWFSPQEKNSYTDVKFSGKNHRDRMDDLEQLSLLNLSPKLYGF